MDSMAISEQANEYKKAGIAFDSGSEGTVDKDKAIECFLKEAECGDPNGYLYAGKIYQFDKKDDAKAFECFLKAAEHQVPQSYNYVSLCYKKGLGTAKDETKAMEYARLGKEAGDFFSAYNLGLWLYNDASKRFEAYDCFLAAKASKGFSKAKPEIQQRIESLLLELAPQAKEQGEGVQPEPKKESKPWLLGFYIILMVLGVAGIILSCLAVFQLKQPSWYGLLGLFIPMVLFNVVPFVFKKTRYNEIHFYIDCLFALGYIVAILVAAILWYKAKGI